MNRQHTTDNSCRATHEPTRNMMQFEERENREQNTRYTETLRGMRWPQAAADRQTSYIQRLQQVC